MVRHRLTIVGDKNSILCRSQRQDFGVGDSFQTGLVRRHKIKSRFVAPTTFDDGVVEVGIRQKADHPSASPRRHLPPHALELLLDVGRGRMGRNVGVLSEFTFRNHLLHFIFVAPVEGDRAIDLIQIQSRIV